MHRLDSRDAGPTEGPPRRLLRSGQPRPCLDFGRLLDVLGECGLVHLGGRWIEMPVRGQSVLLAGSELPWFGRRPTWRLPAARRGPAASSWPIAPINSPGPASHADLFLAGHTHGGQIRLPLIGPIFSPSREGVMYASGLFHAPPTIMHVTRGVSAKLPLRMNCRPSWPTCDCTQSIDNGQLTIAARCGSGNIAS